MLIRFDPIIMMSLVNGKLPKTAKDDPQLKKSLQRLNNLSPNQYCLSIYAQFLEWGIAYNKRAYQNPRSYWALCQRHRSSRRRIEGPSLWDQLRNGWWANDKTQVEEGRETLSERRYSGGSQLKMDLKCQSKAHRSSSERTDSSVTVRRRLCHNAKKKND